MKCYTVWKKKIKMIKNSPLNPFSPWTPFGPGLPGCPKESPGSPGKVFDWGSSSSHMIIQRIKTIFLDHIWWNTFYGFGCTFGTWKSWNPWNAWLSPGSWFSLQDTFFLWICFVALQLWQAGNTLVQPLAKDTDRQQMSCGIYQNILFWFSQVLTMMTDIQY